MQLIPPSPSNGYAIPLGQTATREFLQLVFSSIGERLRAAEASEADYQAAIDLITTQALALVSANVAEEVEVQRANVAAIRLTLEALLAEYEEVQTGGVPASGISVVPIVGLAGTNVRAVLGSIKAAIVDVYTKAQADARYATPANVAAAVTRLISAAPGALDTLDELAAALGDDANFAATIMDALGNRVKIDAAQTLTEPQKGQGRANLGLNTAKIMQLLAPAMAAEYVYLPGGTIGANKRIIKANGAAITRASYPDLWAYVQGSGMLAASQGGKTAAQFGPGDGTTTFTLPDARGYFLRALDDGRGVDVARSISAIQAMTTESHQHELPFGFDGTTMWPAIFDPGATAPLFGSTVAITTRTQTAHPGAAAFAIARIARSSVPAAPSGETRPINLAAVLGIRY